MRIHRLPNCPNNRGFSLVELLIAMALGAFLLSGILQIFSSAKQSYKLQEDLARLQESGRLALDQISYDVRMAGYWGCSKLPPSIAGYDGYSYEFSTAIQGFEAITDVWQPPLDPSFPIESPDNVLQGSDILTIRRADALRFTDTTPENLDLGLAVMAKVSDCSKPPEQPLVLTSANKEMIENGKYYGLNTISYYVAVNANKEKLLYRKVNDIKDELDAALADGIEQMQVCYGVDTDDGNTTPDYYISADKVLKTEPPVDWENVVSARIYLLAATLNNVADKPVPYRPFDEEYCMLEEDEAKKSKLPDDPNDKKIRRWFATTVAIRNRID